MTGWASEHERIRAAYRFYDSSAQEQRKRDAANPGVRRNAETRWAALWQALSPLDLRTGSRILDVGCGSGEDLRRIAGQLGELCPRLHGVDLLPDRVAAASRAVPGATFHVGGGERLPYDDHSFDVVIAATVFSSILDDQLARAVAGEMLRLVAATGRVLCYDMRYPNPWNSRTRAVGATTLRQLFPGTAMRLTAVTLLPPLARCLGALAPAAYPPLHALPFLRSHYVAEIRAAA
jgi:ubiquinone/menaquinone biosynthesis C-methylase UbiE